MTNHETDMLMKRIARGDMAALEELYRGMSKPVYFYALHLTGSPEAAEDIMQDTFVSIMRSSESYHAEGKGNSWIFTIAANKAADMKRKQRDTDSLDKAENTADKFSFTDKSDSESSALRMLDILDKKERDIVILRLFADMTLTQAAKELNMPKGTAFWAYNNAVKKLRKAYDGGGKNEK